jgi:hypothetical protein
MEAAYDRLNEAGDFRRTDVVGQWGRLMAQHQKVARWWWWKDKEIIRDFASG